MADHRVAVTGATGAVGSRVARLLSSRGMPQRLVVRDRSRAPAVEAETAVIGSYLDRAGMRAALAGCTTLFMVSARESADRMADHQAVVESAQAAGVERVVYLSFQGAAENCTFTFGRHHWHTERLIAATSMAYCFLRDSFYQDALAKMCGLDGLIRGPAGDGAVAAVAHEDVAAVAAAVLADPAWDGQTLEVTGPEAITLHRAAELLTMASGRVVRYVEETEEEAFASRAKFAAPDFEVTGWVSSYQAIAAGEVSRVSDTVERVTGQAATDFASYLRTHPKSYRHLLT